MIIFHARMDGRTDAQDVHRCDLCEENMVDMLCVVCPQKVCKSCVGDHLEDDPSRHTLVKYQYRNTTLVLPICSTHSSERCKHFCQECDEPVCPSCISSDIHKKHVFLKISEILHARKEIINNDTKELGEIVFPSYTINVQKEESYATTLEKDYQTLKQSIGDQRTEWHDEIDKFVNNLQNETDEMSDIQLNALNKHLQKVKELCTEIQDTIKGNKDLLKSTNVTKTLSYKKQKFIIEMLSRRV